MASAAVATRAFSSTSTSSAASRFLTSDFSRQDYFGGKREVKVLPTRRSSTLITAAVQNSSEAPIRYGNACIDLPCAINCPVNTPTSRNVERWVEESVHEIVKNIQEAPFLQYVFDSKSRYGSRFKRQKITQEVFENPSYWPSVRESFSKVDAPDGVILVQRLKTGESKKTCCLADAMQQQQQQGGSSSEEQVMTCPVEGDGGETNVWGVLVQARGFHVNACYLLKTTRVTSSVGTCTRYCLTRATCFGPSYLEQLETAWLL